MIIGMVIVALVALGIIVGVLKSRRRRRHYDLEALVAKKRVQEEVESEHNEFLKRHPEAQQHMNEGANSPWNVPPF